MKYIAIYDSKGTIVFGQYGDYYSPVGDVRALEIEVPDGYYVESVNPETGEPVLAEIPKTEEQQRIDEREAKQAEDDERYIDQEYRMTLMELGLDDTETGTGQ